MPAPKPMLFGLFAAVLGGALASTYVGRLSDHRGYHLVPFEDVVRAPPLARPRRALFVLVDGLRRDHAEKMVSVARLRGAGQCRPTRVGLPSVSRPVYAVMSTGLEQDRTGARNNDERTPLAAESVWEVARGAGLRVEARSDLAWWRELFPRGFDAYAVSSSTVPVMPRVLTASVTLVHPAAVDEAAHDHRADSAEYAREVAAVDESLTALLATLDLREDLVVLTADHGHRDRGGHGGPSPEVIEVLTCFAGPGVAHGSAHATLDARIIAPTFAALLGLRFPRHLRAGEDGLGAMFTLLDEAQLGTAYVADRRRAVDAARRENEAALMQMSEGRCGTWSCFESEHATAQQARGLAAMAIGTLLLAAVLRRTSSAHPRSILLGLAMVAAMFAGYALLAGGLDATSLNRRDVFLQNTFAGSTLGLLAMALPTMLLANRARSSSPPTTPSPLIIALTVATAVLVLTNVAHLAAFGWPLGYPIPNPYLYFLPFLTSTFEVTAGAALTMAALRRQRGSSQS